MILRGRKLSGRAYLVSVSGTVVPPPLPPLLTITGITGLVPGGTSAASLTFSRGAPATITAVLDGASLPIVVGSIITTAGSGATASGTAAFTFTTPAAGTHAIVASGPGPYGTPQSNAFVITTAPVVLPPPAAPTLTITSVTGLSQGGTSIAALAFAHGAPTPATITAKLDGVSLTIANVSVSTAAGSGATASGTANFTFTTPAVGTHTLVVSSTGAYAVPQSNAYVLTATAPLPSPTPGVAPPALSGIVITQTAPIWAGHGEGTPVAFCDPIGGIGPFLWGMTDPSGLYHIDAGSGDITVTSAPVGTATHTLTISCYDARIIAAGPPYAPITRSHTVAKRPDNAPGMAMNSRNPVTNAVARAGVPYPVDGPYFSPQASGADHSFARDNLLLVSNPGGKWARHTANTFMWNGGKPVPGNYPVTVSATSPGGDVQTLATTFRVVEFTPVTYIEFVPTVPVVSTATVIGRVIGRLAATTPNNSPSWTINDPTGTVAVAALTGEVTVIKAPTAGTLSFTATVLDGLATFTETIQRTIAVGTILPSTNMTLTPNPALDNSRQNQSVGTPSVTGVTGTKSWLIISQTGFNIQATVDVRGFQQPARYQIDAVTGAITTAAATATSVAALMSYQRTDYNYVPDRITVSCTDGINTCTREFTIPVAEAPTTYLFVNRGSNPAPGGVTGTDVAGATPALQLGAANAICGNFHPGIKYHVYVWPDLNNPDGYTDATRGHRNGWVGPGRIEGVTVNGQRPRFGGLASNAGVGTGTSDGNKGFLLISHGDWEVVNIEGAYCHGGDTSHGFEFSRKDGNSWGNLYLSNCYLHDNDQGLECGVEHGYITVDNCVFSQNGGASVGAGLTHNIYIGTCSRFTMRNSVSRRILYGHLVKCRAIETVIDNCRIYDSSSGAAANCINLPNFGKVSITNSVLMKGPFATNPFMVSAGEDGPTYDVNTLTASGNVFDMRSLAFGGKYASIVAVNHWYMNSPNGAVPSRVTLTNNQISFTPGGLSTSGDPHWIAPAAPVAGATTETGTITLAIPPALDVSDPSMPGSNLPVPRRPYRHRAILEQPMFGNFSNVLQMHSAEEFRISHAAPLGSPVITFTAAGDMIDNPGGDLFGPQTNYAIVFDQLNASNPNPWAPQGAFVVASNADGSATLKTAGTLPAGLYWVQTRATKGVAISDGRWPVVVT